ncbi:hypothetical protein HAALTHF_29160n [Vreelandella aquamarina]|nr:hypothetical protein HAALTHF_29160n [Halomonas axialensis]
MHVQANISGMDVAGGADTLGNGPLDNSLLSCVRLFHDLPPSIVALHFGPYLNVIHDVEEGRSIHDVYSILKTRKFISLT